MHLVDQMCKNRFRNRSKLMYLPADVSHDTNLEHLCTGHGAPHDSVDWVFYWADACGMGMAHADCGAACLCLVLLKNAGGMNMSAKYI